MSNAQVGAMMVLSLAAIWLTMAGVNVGGRYSVVFYIAAAICAAPGVIALFVTAVAG